MESSQQTIGIFLAGVLVATIFWGAKLNCDRREQIYKEAQQKLSNLN